MDEVTQAAADAVEAALAIPELAQEEIAEEQEQEVPDIRLVEDEESEEVEAEAVADEEAEESESLLPEGYVDVAVVPEEQLVTQFKILDAEGEVEVPDLMIEYKANGKIRKDRLDHVVKMAQLGVYNDEREQQVKAIKQESEKLYSQVDQYRKLLQEREHQMARLIEDDDYLFLVRDRYDQENSPEARAARAEQRVQQLQASQQLQYIEQRGTQFYEGEVLPAIEMISNALPTITSDELAERMVKSVQPHLRRGPTGDPYIPEESYDAIRSYIVDDLVFWAQMQHQRRGGTATNSEMEKAQQDLEKARVEAQKAKRAVGKKTRPVGKAQADKKRSNSRPIDSVDDAVNSALESVLAGIQ